MNDALFPIFRSISRRDFLQLGSIAAGGLAFSDLSQQRAGAASAPPKPDTSVILVWLPGGPPHTETYDLKPDAPSDYRGEFQSIHTNVPGIDICELLAWDKSWARPIDSANIPKIVRSHPTTCGPPSIDIWASTTISRCLMRSVDRCRSCPSANPFVN
jgi:hypothetical protein